MLKENEKKPWFSFLGASDGGGSGGYLATVFLHSELLCPESRLSLLGGRQPCRTRSGELVTIYMLQFLREVIQVALE